MSNINLPLGFIISITQNKDALKFFSTLDGNAKRKISDYIENSATDNQKKIKVDTCIKELARHNLIFLN